MFSKCLFSLIIYHTVPIYKGPQSSYLLTVPTILLTWRQTIFTMSNYSIPSRPLHMLFPFSGMSYPTIYHGWTPIHPLKPKPYFTPILSAFPEPLVELVSPSNQSLLYVISVFHTCFYWIVHYHNLLIPTHLYCKLVEGRGQGLHILST